MLIVITHWYININIGLISKYFFVGWKIKQVNWNLLLELRLLSDFLLDFCTWKWQRTPSCVLTWTKTPAPYSLMISPPHPPLIYLLWELYLPEPIHSFLWLFRQSCLDTYTNKPDNVISIKWHYAQDVPQTGTGTRLIAYHHHHYY